MDDDNAKTGVISRKVYPFAAIVGQEEMKLALILNAIDPRVGGVLIRGEKGTAKSTGVRGLAALLPEIKVVAGCRFRCDPEAPEDYCRDCRGQPPQNGGVTSRVKFVDLPLNATEDMVLGGIDFEAAVKQGTRQFQPGLLAKANRGILYIDEVNLLDDHLVDIILDTAASGVNVVEREGISFQHPARLILVGTMNPEEGDLRPQLLDRFGLCIEVHGSADLEARVELMQRREDFDTQPEDFSAAYRAENEKIAHQIAQAKKNLPNVRFPKHLRPLISELCLSHKVAGHRADIIIERAALALAAYRGKAEAGMEEIKEVAAMALLHRRRETMPPPPPPPPPEPPLPEPLRDDSPEDDHREEPDRQENQLPEETMPPLPQDREAAANGRDNEVAEHIFEVGTTFKVKRFSQDKDRKLRRGSGRRSRTRTALKQGRYVKSIEHRHGDDLALDATVRAAAPYQHRRRRPDSSLAVHIHPEDVRHKVREKRIGNFLLFIVDASGSMGARGRMAASKGAIMSLLLDAYQKRDRVAMVSFRKREAWVNLPPTSSIEMAGKLLEEMPVGGRTPLSAGLFKGYEILRNYLLKDPASEPIVIVITDGKANIACGESNPVTEALSFARQMTQEERIKFIVVDTEEAGIVSFGLAAELAAALGANYFKIEDLKANELVDVVRRNIS
ncbi:MAG: putative cobaltochelatase [Desulfobacca sp.]|nr:putative cobaltochelatase [Desulfobacca sp.]